MNGRLMLVGSPKMLCVALAAMVMCAGCIPIEITRTIKISTDAPNLPIPPGAAIPDSFAPDPVNLCKVIPEEYQDLDALLQTYAADLGLGFLLNYVKITQVDLVQVAMQIADGQGTFDGLTEVSATRDGEILAAATPGNGIDATQIVLTPDTPIDLLAVLEDCPTVGFSIRGNVPLNPPDSWDNLVTLRVVAELSFF